MKHSEVLKDWKYLWSIGPAHDMTGGYVDQEDLDKLLKKPTEKTAISCLISQMEYWFTVGIEAENALGNKEVFQDKRAIKIKEKYNF